MSAAPPPGAARGDRSVYSGRALLGVTRASVSGVLAWDASGNRIGVFGSEREARQAVHVRAGVRAG